MCTCVVYETNRRLINEELVDEGSPSSMYGIFCVLGIGTTYYTESFPRCNYTIVFLAWFKRGIRPL